MSMNGIDIASYQAGIDLGIVPCDFVIIKATQGVSYVNPDCDRAYQNAKKAGKCLGIYHYASGPDAVSEANFFYNNIKGYIGEAILVLDWESGENPAFAQGPAYAKTFLDRIYQLTKVRPLIYMSKSVCSQYNWSSVSSIAELWVAQYASMNSTGYQTAPWTDGNGYGSWGGPAIFQYSSSGRLNGWNGNLDINVAYFDREGWNKRAGKGNSVTPIPTPSPTPLTPSKTKWKVGDHVIFSTCYSSSSDPTSKAIQASSMARNHGTITSIANGKRNPYLLDNGLCWVNDGDIRGRYGQSSPAKSSQTTYLIQSGDSLSGIASKFGVTVESIQSANGISNPNLIYAGNKIVIPGKLSTKTQSSAQYHTVQSGETLSGIASKYGTTYQKIASLNGISDPNKIYAGTNLRVK